MYLLIFLDWERAFDKISHLRLVESLERRKFDSKLISNIRALYANILSSRQSTSIRKVNEKNNTLEFVILPALVPFFVYFDDERFVSRCEAQEQWSSLPKDSQQHEISRTPVRWWHASSGNKNPKMRTNIWDISRKSQSITTYCNAKLNRDKCVCVTFNRNNQITFADEQLLESVDETIYTWELKSTKGWIPKLKFHRQCL